MSDPIEVGDQVLNLATGLVGEVTVDYGDGVYGVAMQGSGLELVLDSADLETKL